MPSERVKLTITDVKLAVPASVGVEAGMVVLSELQPPRRMLRIIIAQPEARAIMSAWEGAVPGRPSTWDLLLSAIALLGGRVEAAVITAVEEERHYFAMLELSEAGEARTLSCRPSDAIALAVRAYGAEILAEEAVLEAAGVLADGSRPPPKPPPSLAEIVPPFRQVGAAEAMGVPRAVRAEPPGAGEDAVAGGPTDAATTIPAASGAGEDDVAGRRPDAATVIPRVAAPGAGEDDLAGGRPDVAIVAPPVDAVPHDQGQG